MKITLFPALIMMAFLLHPMISLAQQTEGAPATAVSIEKKAEKQTRWITNYLRLDKETTGLLYSLQLSYLMQTDSVRVKNTDMLDNRDVYSQLAETRKLRIQSILTPEQYVQYTRMFEKERKKRHTP